MGKTKYYLIWCCLPLFLFNACRKEPDILIDVKRISNKAAVFSCLDVNVSAVVSGKGIIIIDTNRSPGIMKKILEKIEDMFGRNDVIYIINTHGHWDHSAGNQVFDKAEIVGHKNCGKYIMHNMTNSPLNIWLLEKRISRMKKEVSLPGKSEDESTEIKDEIAGWNLILKDMKNGFVPTPPTITFSDSLTLDAGDLTIKMIYCGNAHTNNDIFIYIPEEKLIFTGDMFNTESRFGFPINKLVDIPGIISSMDKIISDLKEIKFVIPGHGDVFPGSAFNRLRQLLKKRFNEIKEGESGVKLLETRLEEADPNLTLEKYSSLYNINTDSHYYWSEDEFNILGRRYTAMGMYDKAIIVFTLDARSFPNSALAYDNLGEAYLKNGSLQAAIENYKKSISIFPNNTHAKEILEFLRNNGN
jgi:cyclase